MFFPQALSSACWGHVLRLGCTATAASPDWTSRASSRLGLENKHLRAAGGEVPHVGSRGLPFGTAESALQRAEIVEAERRDQVIAGRAGGRRHRAGAHFVFSQAR